MSISVPLTSFFNDVKICVTSYFMYGADQYHWALWNTHHIKLTFVTPTNKLCSFLLIFELFSLIFYWKYSIFLHETPHKWNMMWHIFWRHWRMTSKERKRTSRNTKKWKLKTQIYLIRLESVFEKKTMVRTNPRYIYI
jgi:hypothetical protein